MMTKTIGFIIVAAGRGLRAKNNTNDDLPKQFKELNGETVLQHSINVAVNHRDIDFVQVVINKEHKHIYSEKCQNHEKLMDVVYGGETRQQSVMKGLEALKEHKIEKVLIHDAARPFVSAQLISNIIDKLEQHNAVIPTLEITDAMKKINEKGNIIENVNRNEYISAQTPQGFKYNEILKAHEKAQEMKKNEFHDDAEIALWNKMNIYAIKGEKNNVKLTKPEDFQK